MSIRAKEAKTRSAVDKHHPMVRAAIAVLREYGGGPLASRAIFRRAVELRLVDPHQYNSLRSRLSQHCDLPDATVVRMQGSKIGVHGSRTTGWVLRETGAGVQVMRGPNGSLHAGTPHARNLILDDTFLKRTKAPDSLRVVAGRTARQALLTPLPKRAVQALLRRLPLTDTLRARLLVHADDHEQRAIVIEAAERVEEHRLGA